MVLWLKLYVFHFPKLQLGRLFMTAIIREIRLKLVSARREYLKKMYFLLEVISNVNLKCKKNYRYICFFVALEDDGNKMFCSAQHEGKKHVCYNKTLKCRFIFDIKWLYTHLGKFWHIMVKVSASTCMAYTGRWLCQGYLSSFFFCLCKHSALKLS